MLPVAGDYCSLFASGVGLLPEYRGKQGDKSATLQHLQAMKRTGHTTMSLRSTSGHVGFGVRDAWRTARVSYRPSEEKGY